MQQELKLMKGNWVLIDGIKICLTTELIRQIELGYYSAKGIPLTSEILEKCPQFEMIEWYKPKDESRKGCRQYYTKLLHDRACLSFYFGEYIDNPNRLDKVTIGTPPHYSGSNYGNFPIKYLHDLQNLVSLLTNQELIINL